MRTSLRVSVRAFSMAGFQVTLIGRFWVSSEALRIPHDADQRSGMKPITIPF